MTTVPNVSTSAWRLPSKNKAGEKRAGRFNRDAYSRLGLAEIVEKTGVKDRPPTEPASAPASSGGLPSIDTSDWSLSEAKKAKKKKRRGPPSERGKKWDTGTPPRRGKPVLFGGDEEEDEGLGRTAVKMAGKAEMRGLSMDRITQLRRLAGLEQNEEIEFSHGTPHRRMPSEGRAVPRREVQEREELGSTSQLPHEVRRLVDPRSSLPSGGFVPDRATGSGILDPMSEREVHGESYIDRVLAESRWFMKDFSALGEEPRRDDWQGSDPDYSDELVDPDDDEDEDEPDDDDEDDEDDEKQEARRRIKIRHTKPGGRGKVRRQKRQSQQSRLRNRDPRTKHDKKGWERKHKAQRARARRLSRMMSGDELDLDEVTPEAVEERLGDVLKKVGGSLSHGTDKSRDIVGKAKDRVRGAFGSWKSSQAKKRARRAKAKARLKRMKKKKKQRG